MDRVRPKIGFVMLGRRVYPNPSIAEMRDQALKQLRTLDADVHECDMIPYYVDEAVGAARELAACDVDAVVAYVASYPSEELLCVLSVELANVPIVVWSKCDTPLTTLAGAGMITSMSNLRTMGRDPFPLLEGLSSDHSLSTLERTARAAAAAKRVRRSAIGVAGRPNLGMLDITYDESCIRRIAPGIHFLDGGELIALSERVSEDAASGLAREIASASFIGNVEVPFKEVVGAARSCLVVRAIVEKYRLAGITIREWPELGVYGVTIGLASALLNDEGVVCVQEADVPTTVCGVGVTAITGEPFYLGEIAKVDVATNSVLLFHEGGTPFSLIAAPPGATLTYNRVSVERYTGKQEGISVESQLRPGRVTIVKMSGKSAGGALQGIAVGANVLPYEGPRLPGSGIGRVQFDAPVSKVLETWMSLGFEHHMMVVYGDHVDDFRSLMRMLGVSTTAV